MSANLQSFMSRCASRTVAACILPMASGLPAAAQETIDLLSCPALPHQIAAEVGVPLSLDILATNAMGNVFWVFDEAPAPSCTLDGDAYLCANGVDVSTPGINTSVSSLLPVQVTGTPTNKDIVTFALEVTDLTNTCVSSFEMALVSDIAFVLDRSGSMDADADPGDPGTSRWDALVAGVLGFAPLISTTVPDNSRFGLTLFSTSILLPATMTPVTAALPTTLSTTLAGESPDGLTALGAGLKNAEAAMSLCSRARVAVVFTDGQQNQPPEVLASGTGYDDGTSINITCPAGPEELEVVSVGIMGPGSAYLSTLQNLATANGSNPTIISTTGTGFTGGACTGDIATAFVCAVVPALSGNSPQLIATHTGLFTGPVTLPAFSLNRRVGQLLVQIGLTQRFEIPDLVRILGGIRILRDGVDVTAYFEPIITGNFTDGALLRTDFAHQTLGAIPPEGSWVVQWNLPTRRPGLGYKVVIFADDHRLGMDWGVSPAAPQVDQPFQASLTLDWRGAPVTGASVEALVLAPGNDLGDVLANHPLNVDPSGARDAQSPGDQKYQALLEDSDFLAQMLPNEQVVPLTDPDNDGAYTGSFDPGDVSGVYQMIYRVSATDPEFGTVERLAAQSVYVRFGDIDLDASEASSSVTAGGVNLAFRPRTTNGRLIGPAQGSAISVEGAGLSLTSVTDNQDGSYTLALSGDPTADVSIRVLGDEVFSGAASDFGGAALPMWLWLLVVLALIVIWVIRRLIH